MRVLRLGTLVLISSGFSLLLAAIAGEAYFGYFSKSSSFGVLDERNLSYHYDPDLGWFPEENGNSTFTGISGLVIHARNNHWGLRDVEHGDKARRRIAVLGDSFVWGYDVEAEDRFTDKMQAVLPDWEVINMGVSGYGTDQEYLLLQKFFDRVQPDVVMLVFYANDHDDNSSNVRYRGYYKPYFIETPGGMTLKGTPVPKSINYYHARFPWLARKSSLFRATLASWQRLAAPPPMTNPEPTAAVLRALLQFVRKRNSALVLVSVEPEPIVDKFARQERVPHVVLPQYPTTPSGHWTAEGHTAVAHVLSKKLTDLFPSGS